MLELLFSHRPQRNGSYDSICIKCAATIARSHNEADLEAAEKLHSCNRNAQMRRGGVREESWDAGCDQAPAPSR